MSQVTKELYEQGGAQEQMYAPVPDTGDAYPGTPLRLYTTGGAVLRMQQYLNAIRAREGGLPVLQEDGIFGHGTHSAVLRYQQQHGLASDGVIGEKTWNSIVSTYHTLPAEDPAYPGTPLRRGSSGAAVRLVQERLNPVGVVYTAINHQEIDGKYGQATEAAVRRFQRQFGLSADGVVGSLTWNRLLDVYSQVGKGVLPPVTTVYPGSLVRRGSNSDSTRFVQSYLSSIPTDRGGRVVAIDSRFGSATEEAVKHFQRVQQLKVDGIVGADTWSELVRIFNQTLRINR